MHMYYTVHFSFNKSRIIIIILVIRPYFSSLWRDSANGRRPRQRPLRPGCSRQTAPKTRRWAAAAGGLKEEAGCVAASGRGRTEKVIKCRRGRGERERRKGKKEGGEFRSQGCLLFRSFSHDWRHKHKSTKGYSKSYWNQTEVNLQLLALSSASLLI